MGLIKRKIKNIFDAVLKDQFTRGKSMVIDFINTNFDKEYPKDTPIIVLSTEQTRLYEEKTGVFMDIHLMIEDCEFHIEG